MEDQSRSRHQLTGGEEGIFQGLRIEDSSTRWREDGETRWGRIESDSKESSDSLKSGNPVTVMGSDLQSALQN